MPSIELDDQTADKLAAHARAQGLTIAEYLRSLVLPTSNGHSDSPSLDELEAELDALVHDLPTLPSDFSRAEIYNEHD